jgi:hypothetical protein
MGDTYPKEDRLQRSLDGLKILALENEHVYLTRQPIGSNLMTTETQDINATTTQQNPAPTTSTSTAQEGQNQSAKTYTQAELDLMMGERAKRAQDSATKKLLSALGLTSEAEIDALKATIAEAQTLKKSQMTEVEKAQAERDSIIKERDTLKSQLEQQAAMIREREIQSAVKTAVATMRANDFDAIYLWAEKYHAESLKAVIGDDGKVDAKALERLLEAVKKDKPTYFVAVVNVPGSQSNANGHVNPQNQKFDLPKVRI